MLIEKSKQGQEKAYRTFCVFNVIGKLLEQLLLVRLQAETERTDGLAETFSDFFVLDTNNEEEEHLLEEFIIRLAL